MMQRAVELSRRSLRSESVCEVFSVVEQRAAEIGAATRATRRTRGARVSRGARSGSAIVRAVRCQGSVPAHCPLLTWHILQVSGRVIANWSCGKAQAPLE